MSADRFLSWATTHVGTVRSHNEDALVDRPDLGLWAVADGAGGHARGDVASRMIVEALEAIPPDLSAADVLSEVRRRVTEAHDTLRGDPDAGEHDISASTVVVMIARGDHYACLWAGDSRAYLLRDGQMSQITRDHSLVQEMVDAGVITADEAETHPSANVITRAEARTASWTSTRSPAGCCRETAFCCAATGCAKPFRSRKSRRCWRCQRMPCRRTG